MRPSSSFSFLLAALLFALAQVEAVPVKQPPRMVTMPLKRLPPRSDVPPSVRLQQHINRSHRRHARMNGLQGPSDAQLVKRLEKRLFRAKYDKRFNRDGVNPVLVSSDEDVSIKGANRLGSHLHRNGSEDCNSNGTVPDGNNQNSTMPTPNQNSTMPTPNQNSTTPTPNQNSTTPNQGFPQAALDALLSTDGITKANQPTALNSLGLDIEGRDIGYLATVQLGTPPREFSIIMDSGSADFWVGGEGCQSQDGGDCGNHVFLGPQSSSSFNDNGTLFQVTYGAGQVTGDIVADNLNIAGLALDQHVFGVALVESKEFSNETLADGLMGLAQSPLSNQGVLTPVEALAKQGLISEAITSYKISRVSDGLNDGEVTFGGLDETKFDPNTLVTVDNVSPLGFWEADFTVSVDGQDLGLSGRTAILDTGTTLVIAPPDDIAAVHAKIPGAKSDGQDGFIIPCTNNAIVSFTFGGKSFDINPTDLLFAPVDPNDLQGDCISGFTSGQFGGPQQWLVGDVFLKNAYFSTDVNKNSISLATPV